MRKPCSRSTFLEHGKLRGGSESVLIGSDKVGEVIPTSGVLVVRHMRHRHGNGYISRNAVERRGIAGGRCRSGDGDRLNTATIFKSPLSDGLYRTAKSDGSGICTIAKSIVTDVHNGSWKLDGC